ncbi:MAG: hypothetical protein P6E94_02965 [Acidimicrobiales bacterium]|nr:hypothetical protein [Acidimicrobiales bacterium]
MGRFAEAEGAMKPVGSSKARNVFILLAIILIVGYLGGCLGKTTVDRDEAIRIARHQIDFVPERTNVELGRQGFPPKAVWGVTFWIEAKDGGEAKERGDEFERRTAVEVHADTGKILRIHSDP